jgi:hypothetical protein
MHWVDVGLSNSGHISLPTSSRGKSTLPVPSHSCDDHVEVQAQTSTISSSTVLRGGRNNIFFHLQLLVHHVADISRPCNLPLLELEHGKSGLLGYGDLMHGLGRVPGTVHLYHLCLCVASRRGRLIDPYAIMRSNLERERLTSSIMVLNCF